MRFSKDWSGQGMHDEPLKGKQIHASVFIEAVQPYVVPLGSAGHPNNLHKGM
jgi:hypothetical protein